jgi:hypothetical protein
MKIKEKVQQKSTFGVKNNDQIIVSPEIVNYKRKQPMPEVQLDFKKAPPIKVRKDSSQLPTPSTNRRLTPMNYGKGAAYIKMEEDLKIPLNNPQYNEMINTQLDHYNFY